MNKSNEVAIKVTNVSKTFKLPHEKNSSIKNLILNPFKRRTYEKQRVLKDISFEIKKGEFFGIIGRNGSGKSTMLKLLAGIYSPDKGHIQVNGKLTPFIELGVGFNPELTGRENVFLNGALLGFNRKEMSVMYDEIVEFAEIEKFMDQKLKNYSSGMQVRLAFSIAIRANTDILLLDEVLAVGDEAFQKKCTNYFVELKNRGQTVILVTHDMPSVERFCDRVLVLDKSNFVGIYPTKKAVKIYSQLNREDSEVVAINKMYKLNNRWGTKRVAIESVHVNGRVKGTPIISQEDPLDITIETTSKNSANLPITIGLGIYTEDNVYLAGPNTLEKNYVSGDRVTFSLPNNPFNPGIYRLAVALFSPDLTEEFDHIEDAMYIEIISVESKTKYGKMELFGKWQKNKQQTDTKN